MSSTPCDLPFSDFVYADQITCHATRVMTISFKHYSKNSRVSFCLIPFYKDQKAFVVESGAIIYEHGDFPTMEATGNEGTMRGELQMEGAVEWTLWSINLVTPCLMMIPHPLSGGRCRCFGATTKSINEDVLSCADADVFLLIGVDSRRKIKAVRFSE
ncbi:hypothetical protein ACH5RR_001323 [Cinchona calisaya]|uniref:Uncharacterized protein n=1 Tax=Cinchona calisaya TaxID=153742 RepID=A0ABD3B496_9GENT